MKKLFILMSLLAPFAVVSGDVLKAATQASRALDRLEALRKQIEPKKQPEQSLTALIQGMLDDLPRK